ATIAAAQWREVLPQADWLLLACPLNAQTRGMVDAAALALLPAHAGFVNVSRGEIVDEPALVAALREGRLAGANLDVFAQEPLPAGSPLWTMPNVIATPHSAGLSGGNAARVQEMFLDNLRRWAAGEPLRNVARD
ncbi:MAG TPA: NAD(P)-dependent oxidoreductase, partial [Ramlibacter sp.]